MFKTPLSFNEAYILDAAISCQSLFLCFSYSLFILHLIISIISFLLSSSSFNVYEKNLKIINNRTNTSYYSKYADVTCEISTKGRFHTTLPLALVSVACQELKPKEIIIIQDDPSEFNMLESDVYRHIFMMFELAGIKWSVI